MSTVPPIPPLLSHATQLGENNTSKTPKTTDDSAVSSYSSLAIPDSPAVIARRLLVQAKSLIRGRHPKSLGRHDTQVFVKYRDSERRLKAVRGSVGVQAVVREFVALFLASSFLQ